MYDIKNCETFLPYDQINNNIKDFPLRHKSASVCFKVDM